MKHLRVILFAVISCSIFSCSKNNNDVKPTDQLIGNWKMTSMKYTGTSGVQIGGYPTHFSGTGKNMDLHLSFAVNPKTFSSRGDYTITLTASFEGQELQQDYTINGFMGGGTWEKIGTTLTVTDKETGKPQSAIISKLDNKTMEIRWGGDIAPSNSYGMPATVTVNGTYVFEKE